MPEQIYLLPILLFSVVIHEIAHGWVALRLGDPTARDVGRLTLNPIPHIDLVGSILVPLLSLASTGRIFIAWAKPVPINPANFSNVRRDDILVSIVGPISNIALSFVFTLVFVCLLKLESLLPDGIPLVQEGHRFFLKMFYGGIILNIILAVFNMIPIPPLDGSHVLASILPAAVSEKFRKIGFFGIFGLIFLMQWAPFAGVFEAIITTIALPFQLLIHWFV